MCLKLLHFRCQIIVRGANCFIEALNKNDIAQIKPDYMDYWEYCYWGLRHWNNGWFLKIINEATESIKNNPQNVKAFVYRGVANMYMGFADEAINDFSRAVEINSNQAIEYFDEVRDLCIVLKEEEFLEKIEITFNKTNKL